MERGVRFSLSDLPERYRVQAIRQLSPKSVAAPAEGQERQQQPAAENAPQPKKGKSAPLRAPVRMKKAEDGPNKTEAQFNREMLHGIGKYEAVTLHLPGGVKYTPDFLFERDGDTFLVEVKGSYRLPTHGRSVAAFKSACAQFPMFVFLFAELGKDGKTWTVGRYQDGRETGVVRGTANDLQEVE